MIGQASEIETTTGHVDSQAAMQEEPLLVVQLPGFCPFCGGKEYLREESPMSLVQLKVDDQGQITFSMDRIYPVRPYECVGCSSIRLVHEGAEPDSPLLAPQPVDEPQSTQAYAAPTSQPELGER